MKALSIRQPWAWCILHAGKRIENRNWPTNFLGPIYLHASKGMTRAEYEEGLDLCHAIGRKQLLPEGPTMPSIKELPRGGIVGRARIVDCVASHAWLSDDVEPWFFGPYGFLLDDVEPLPFYPCKGARGFFEAEYPEAR